ncbi:non-ribosomal peptide synthetase [Gynuella sunshinyii]|uniref:Polyketide synthase modules-related protein n=1 Tax=Gynuella sunshinyii YC6258 TaxID=1445510 RepID=A0A0C5VLS9_9GAMM|nr:non-ribosomal peptide synthetase [Gynuella sunshinyii]AJQ95677.1 polyketide synthase modules-related protein [Gynuella sunshinyii YC6258]
MEKWFRISADHPILKHHRVYGQRMIPGLAYIDFIYQFFRAQGFSHVDLELRRLKIFSPLQADEGHEVRLHFHCQETGQGSWDVRIDGEQVINGQRHGDFRHYVSAEVHRIEAVSLDGRLDIQRIVSRSEKTVALDDIYRRMVDRELVHSGLMKSQGCIHIHESSLTVEVSLSPDAMTDAAQFMFHPALIDAAAVAAVASLVEGEDRLFLPLVIDSFRASEVFSSRCRVHLEMDSVHHKNELLFMDLLFFDDDDKQIAELKNFSVKLVRDAGFIDPERRLEPLTDQPVGRQARHDDQKATQAEQFLMEMMASLHNQRLEDLDPAREFHEMGLNSAGLLTLVSALETQLATQLSPTLLFEYSTISALAEYLTEHHERSLAALLSKGVQSTAAPAVSRRMDPPGAITARAEADDLSAGQKGLWALQKRHPAMSAYNVPLCFSVTDLNVDIFSSACAFVLRQYPILTAVIRESGGELRHVLQAEQEPYILQQDLRECPPGQLNDVISQAMKQPFSLDQGPLLKCYLFRLSDSETRVLINVHHIIFDGASIPLLMKTLFNGMQMLSNGQQPKVSHVSGSYQQFVQQQTDLMHSPEGRKRLSYWQQQLATPLPVLHLPVSQPRDNVHTAFAGRSISDHLPVSVAEKITGLARAARVSASTVLLGLYKILLLKYSDQRDIVVGIPFNERSQHRYEDVVGFLINMIPIRSQIRLENTFFEFLTGLQKTIVDGLAHSYPFAALIRSLEHDSSQTAPVFQTAFMYHDILKALSNSRHPFQWCEEVFQEGEYELALEVAETADTFILHWKYHPELFSADVIERMADHYRQLMDNVIARPELSLRDYSLLSPAERNRLLYDYNDTSVSYDKTLTVDQLFDIQVQQSPTATAVSDVGRTLSYTRLSGRVNEIADYLRARSSGGSNVHVAVCLHRSVDMVATLLGILRAGMTYIPLDPAFPEQRLNYILADSQASLIVTESDLMTKVTRLLQAATAANRAEVIVLDQPWPDVPATTVLPDNCRQTDNPLAYIIYTSGSTGRPKGVMVTHPALTNFLLSMANCPGMTGADTLLAVTTYSFDIAGLELFLPLIVGGHCYIADTATSRNAEQLKSAIQQLRPTIMQATPSTWSMLFHAGWQNTEQVRILCGGEALPESLKQRFCDSGSDAWNLFGPTETTIWSTLKQLENDQPVNIGKPIANTRIYILDQQQQLTPTGMAGELCIAGDGLAAGYWRRPELTAEKFIENPFEPGDRLYRTGDLARWTSSGELEYLGRLDFQVKLNGFRIELDDIESHMNRHPAIRQSAVVLHRRGEVSHLVGYYVPLQPHWQDINALKAHLQDGLPDYMIPAFFVPLEQMPLTLNGKVDRKSLMEREIVLVRQDDRSSSSQPLLEQQLLSIWKDVLGLEGIHVTDRLMDLGGNSVSAAILAERVSRHIGSGVTVTDLFTYPTIRKLGQYLEKQLPGNDPNVFPEPLSQSLNRSLSSPAEHPDYYHSSLAIVGISCQFPGAEDHWQFWQNLIDGRECTTRLSDEEIARLNLSAAVLNNSAYVPLSLMMPDKDAFDPEFFQISPANAAIMDPQFRQLLMHAWRAVEDAGYVPEDIARTAVFMSASNNFYPSFTGQLSAELQVMDHPQHYVSWILAQGGSIPTMISHQLGLTGASVFVHSNCSSSLTGLYFARQALQSGEVDYALVGGATLFDTFQAGYVHQPGLNFSSDGHCKAFDARADGMIAGEGAGVIMVRRTMDAIDNGDHIYCLLRGISINNDGNDKAGFYAPGVSGQSAVIHNVLQQTGIHPEDISYVEAHGTGTAIGDPIEVAALTQAFASQTRKQQFCAIGSVKPNIGHLDTVAGLAGCIKLAMSLYHKTFPPLINYQQANPGIDFEHSPFYVLEHPSHWKTEDLPKRAALSSFGIGGSNAHAILEEYRQHNANASTAAAPDHSLVLIPLSAMDQQQLHLGAARLLAFLRDRHSDVAIDRLAYTLQVGRKQMPARVGFVVSTVAELVEKLSAFVNGDGPISGLFQQPDQKAAEGTASDDDLRICIQQGRLEQLARLWTQGNDPDWKSLYQPQAHPLRMSLPGYVFKRTPYRYQNPLPRPSVSARQVEKLHPLVHRNDSDFERQQFTVVLNGEEFFLTDHVLGGKKILPGVAYLEMTRFAGEQSCRQPIVSIREVVWMQPVVVGQDPCELVVSLHDDAGQIRFEVHSDAANPILHSQGLLLTGSATQADDHVRTLDISAIRELCNQQYSQPWFYDRLMAVGADYGPAFQVIETLYQNDDQVLARLHLPEDTRFGNDEFFLHPSIMDAAFQLTDSLILQPQESGGYLPFYVKQIDVLRPTPSHGYVHVYFSPGSDRSGSVTRYDIDIADAAGHICISMKEFSARKLVEDELHHQMPRMVTGPEMFYLSPAWQHQPAQTNVSEEHPDDDHVVLLAGVTEGYIHSQSLPAGCRLVYLPHRLEPGQTDVVTFAQQVQADFQYGFEVIQSYLRSPSGKRLRILILVPGNIEHFAFHCLSGLLQTAQLESHRVLGKLVTVEALASYDADSLSAILRQEFYSGFEHVRVRYRPDFTRQIQLTEKLELPSRTVSPLKEGGVYWITGGSGKLGLQLASALMQQKRVNIVLTGRRPLSAPLQQALDSLNSDTGKAVEYWTADVSLVADTTRVVNRIRETYGCLNGIFHCAGVLRDAFILNKTAQDIQQVFAPKVHGLLAIDLATRHEPLDFMVLFSSVSAVFGNIGQADYAAANGFMDAFAGYRNFLQTQGQRYGRTFAIDWSLWQDGGMQIDADNQRALLLKQGVAAMPTEAGVDALLRILSSDREQVIAMAGDRQVMASVYLDNHNTRSEVSIEPVTHSLPVTELTDRVQASLRHIAAQLVDVDENSFDEGKAFGAYGFDSISFTLFTNQLNELYGLEDRQGRALAPTAFFEYPDISALTGYLLDQYQDSIQHHFSDLPEPSPATPSVPKICGDSGESLLPRTSHAEPSVSVQRSPSRSTGDDIAIIGMSGKFPQASDIDEYWQNLVAGRDCISEIPQQRWSWQALWHDSETASPSMKWGGFIEGYGDFDPLFFGISPRDAEIMDPAQRLLLMHSWLAIEDAGYAASRLSGSRTAVFVGIGNSGYGDRLTACETDINGQTVIATVPSMGPSRVSHFLNLRGPSEPVDTACSSSLVAIHRGVNAILHDDADMAIVGGVQGMFSPAVHISFAKAGMLSPDGRCKTFSDQADGYVRGEGIGILILKKLASAEHDQDRIYGIIKASAENHGGRGNSLTAPNPEAQTELLVSAYTRAGVDPRSIGYIEAHGTGTALGDPIEINSLKAAFQRLYQRIGVTIPDHQHRCGIGSVKTNIGHLELAAGVAGVIKVLLQMQHRTLVPSLHGQPLNSHIHLQDSPFYLVTEQQPWQRTTDANGDPVPLRAGISSFGFGGVNAHVVLEEYQPVAKPIPAVETGQGVIIVLSARTRERLHAYALKLLQFMDSEPWQQPEVTLASLAYTLQTGREAMSQRLAFVAHSREDVREYLQAYLAGADHCDQPYATHRDQPDAPLMDMHAIAARWAKGADIDWQNLYRNGTPRKIRVPAYPFATEKYWLQPDREPYQPVRNDLHMTDRELNLKLSNEFAALLDAISKP